MNHFVRLEEMALFRTFVRAVAFLSSLIVVTTADDAYAGGFWDRTVTQAIKESAEGAQWILVYFPSPLDREDPPQVTAFPPPGTQDGLFIGARVRADEVSALLKKYNVGELPALVVLDPYGTPRRLWEVRWTVRSVVRNVTLLNRQLRKLLVEIDRKATAAENAFGEKKYTESIAICREVIRKAPRSERRVTARERVLALEAKMLAVANGELLDVLAREGLIADRELELKLVKLETKFGGLLPFEQRIAREKARLKGRKIGG